MCPPTFHLHYVIHQCFISGPSNTPRPLTGTYSYLLTYLYNDAFRSPLAAARFFVFRRGARPQLVQDMINLRKRLRGMPQGGALSIVITDIEGFSGGRVLP